MKITKLLFTAIAALALCVVTTSSCSAKQAGSAMEAAEAESVEAEAVRIPASDDAFAPGMKPERLTIIDFNATWCPPCNFFSPVFDRVAEKYCKQADFYSIDVDRFPATANKFGITSIPTIIFIRPDGTYEKHVGLSDFFEGIPDLDNASDETLLNGMFENMSAMMQAELK